MAVTSDDARFNRYLDDLDEISAAEAKLREMERAADRRYRGQPDLSPAEKPKSRRELLQSGLDYYANLKGGK